MMNISRKIPKSAFAIQAAAPAIPVKPRNPAITEIIRKVIAHPIILTTSLLEDSKYRKQLLSVAVERAFEWSELAGRFPMTVFATNKVCLGERSERGAILPDCPLFLRR